MGLKYFLLIFLSILLLMNNNFASEPLSLKDCISIAEENNPDLIQARIAMEKAGVFEISARSFYYPSVNLNTGVTYKEDDSYSSSVSLTYPVFKGGYFYAGLKIAKAKREMAEHYYRQVADGIIYSIKENFYKILQKQEQIKLIKGILERRKEDLILIKLKYEAGKESLPAVEEAEANLLQAEYDKMRAESEITIAIGQLNKLMGRPRQAKIIIRDEPSDVEFPGIEKIVEDAKNYNPEILAERANRKIFESQIIQARSNYFPTLNLTFSENWNGDTFIDQKNDWRAGISLSLPIFEGFSNRAKVEEAKLSLEQEDLTILELEWKIEEEVEKAYSDWQLAQKNLDVSSKTLKSAYNMYQLTRLQYEQGLTSYFFLQQKEYALTNAEYSYINAVFNLNLSRSKLEKVWSHD